MTAADHSMSIDAPPASSVRRLPLVDAARGLAVAAMVVYHFSWDLRYFGYITVDVTSEVGWLIFARSIAGSFIFIVGVSLVLATRNGINVRAYLRRLAVIVAAAVAITVATRIVFPDSFIFFGILHHIAVASVLGLLFVRAPAVVTVAAAIACFALPFYFANDFFNQPALIWLGLGTILPQSNDFVPVLPWFGVVLAGIATARLALRSQRVLTLAGRPLPTPTLWVGRHTLAIYLLHQPILFGLVYLATLAAPPDLLGFEPSYLENCETFCTESTASPDICQRACSCLASRAQEEDLWTDLIRQTLSDAQLERYYDLAGLCRAEAEAE